MAESAQTKQGTGDPRTGGRARLHLGALRFSVPQFLIALVLLILSTPFVEQMEYGKLIESTLLTVVMLSAVLAIGAGRRTLAWAIVLVIPAIAARWGNHEWPDRIPFEIALVPSLLFILFVVVHFLRFILRAPRVTGEVLCAGVATYLMFGLLWSFAYLLVGRLVPNSFVFTAGPDPSAQSLMGFSALYFSFVTLSTVGYGDIVPIAPAARVLAMAEAMTGTIYLAVLISRLVALYSSARGRDERETPEEKDSQP